MAQPDSQTGIHGAPSLDHAPAIRDWKDLARLSLGALGVVYGDIGTSPLYTMKECFSPEHGVEPLLGNVLGVLSLVFWSLCLVVVVKYLAFVMRADNHGEGGILALLALVTDQGSNPKAKGEAGARRRTVLILLGVFGAALLLADGMITPVISVLGALEGLEVATPLLRPIVVPIAVAILIVLFLFQRKGTAGVGAIFGPAMLVWFAAIAATGLPQVIAHPRVLAALDPLHGLRFLLGHGWHGFLILGSVVLCITGAEALYADMGHFGRRPIRAAWFWVAFPALLLNYFGQGALLLARGAEARGNPFYELAPDWALYPLVVVATAAAVIASQALISGAYSLLQQAIQLGFWPRLTIVHTSREASGQIYVPEVNWALMLACVVLTVGFRSTGNLAAAYGIAVVSTMLITTLLLHTVARDIWHWRAWLAALVAGPFLLVDGAFLAANVVKVTHGGWLPILAGLGLFALMTTWKRGRRLLQEQVMGSRLPIELFLADVGRRTMQGRLPRVSGTTVVMTSQTGIAPPVLMHYFKHSQVLQERVVLLTLITENVPEVRGRERVAVRELGQGFWEVIGRYGFMETPDVPRLLGRCARFGLSIEPAQASYFLGRETILPTGQAPLAKWRKLLFIFLARNARPANAFFRIPPNRVVELGAQVEI
ncbi:MAG: potassium transporter Kup [Thermoanaerobaculia bacterium]|nr:MAG: potassium transporter Kup [Thermoanaerobaculia bacterium]